MENNRQSENRYLACIQKLTLLKKQLVYSICQLQNSNKQMQVQQRRNLKQIQNQIRQIEMQKQIRQCEFIRKIKTLQNINKGNFYRKGIYNNQIDIKTQNPKVNAKFWKQSNHITNLMHQRNLQKQKQCQKYQNQLQIAKKKVQELKHIQKQKQAAIEEQSTIFKSAASRHLQLYEEHITVRMKIQSYKELKPINPSLIQIKQKYQVQKIKLQQRIQQKQLEQQNILDKLDEIQFNLQQKEAQLNYELSQIQSDKTKILKLSQQKYKNQQRRNILIQAIQQCQQACQQLSDMANVCRHRATKLEPRSSETTNIIDQTSIIMANNRSNNQLRQLGGKIFKNNIASSQKKALDESDLSSSIRSLMIPRDGLYRNKKQNNDKTNQSYFTDRKYPLDKENIRIS